MACSAVVEAAGRQGEAVSFCHACLLFHQLSRKSTQPGAAAWAPGGEGRRGEVMTPGKRATLAQHSTTSLLLLERLRQREVEREREHNNIWERKSESEREQEMVN